MRIPARPGLRRYTNGKRRWPTISFCFPGGAAAKAAGVKGSSRRFLARSAGPWTHSNVGGGSSGIG